MMHRAQVLSLFIVKSTENCETGNIFSGRVNDLWETVDIKSIEILETLLLIF